jgi:hypothetical protein
MARAPDIPYRVSLLSDTVQRHRVLAGLVVLLLLVARGARAEAPDPVLDDDAEVGAAAAGFPDPLERLNRLTFRLNLHVDRWVIDPISRAYTFVVPTPARRSIRRAFANLNSPSIFANDALQLRPVDAGRRRSLRRRGPDRARRPPRGFRTDAGSRRRAERSVPHAARDRPDHRA